MLRLFALPFADNAGSIRVLEKAGYVREARSAVEQREVREARDQVLYARVNATLARRHLSRCACGKARRLLRPVPPARDDGDRARQSRKDQSRPSTAPARMNGFTKHARLASIVGRVGDQRADVLVRGMIRGRESHARLLAARARVLAGCAKTALDRRLERLDELRAEEPWLGGRTPGPATRPRVLDPLSNGIAVHDVDHGEVIQALPDAPALPSARPPMKLFVGACARLSHRLRDRQR